MPRHRAQGRRSRAGIGSPIPLSPATPCPPRWHTKSGFVHSLMEKAIDYMAAEIAELLKEKYHKISIIIFCTEEFNLYLREKFILIATIEDLEISIKTLTDEIQVLKAEIAGMQVQLKHAGEDCVKEHKVL